MAIIGSWESKDLWNIKNIKLQVLRQEKGEGRLSLEERKYQLAKQKLTGEIIIDDETEEIIDDLTEDS